MKKNIIDFYYFSGTGNTLIVSETLKKELENLGYSVNLLKIEVSDPQKADTSHTIGIAFPVAVFSTYPFVWEFMKNLPEGNGAEVFVINTMGGFSGWMTGPVKSLFIKKGYKPLGAREFIMPSNFIKLDSPETIKSKTDKVVNEIKDFAKSLSNSSAKWKKIPIIPDLFLLMASSKYPWKLMGKWIKINNEKCTKCGLCAKLCPVKNITMPDYPVTHKKCQVCMRCVSFCPSRAITIRSEKTQTYRSVTADKLLK